MSLLHPALTASSLLATALLAAIAVLVPATALVFTVRPRPAGDPRTPYAVRVAAGSVLVALAGLGVAALLGAEPAPATVVAVGLGGSVLAWAGVGRPWAVRGLVTWALTLDAGALYLGYVLVWTLTAGLSPVALAASGALWLLEAFVFLIGVGYIWEFVDVLARRVWPAAVDPAALSAAQRAHRPFVSLHVPTHNEPPDMVIATLERLLHLDYDDYEVLLVDNNTTDPALWRPVEDFCAQHDRLVFLHLEDWPGFKSGALNHALTVTDPRAEVIGIVDADYLVEPDFLARCAPLFGDPAVSFVQTPQDYRDWEGAPYFRRLYHSYNYFFDVSQRSRNERNGAIFGGTMGLIRRSALADVGGWDEWCITEDTELSLRMLRAGGTGIHVDEAFGKGVMPLTFEALKRQRFRWCFGGVQILRMHWRSLLPGRAHPDNRLSLGQRWAYLVGGLQWFGDLTGVLFTGFLLLGSVDAILGDGVVIRRLSGLLLLSVLVVLVLGILRALALVRRTSGARWGEALGAFGLWSALGWTVAQASARGLFAKEGAFLRTPKVRGRLGVMDAVRGNRSEILLALVCAVVGVAALSRQLAGPAVIGVLLLIQAAGFVAAPVNSVAAIRSDLPEDLRRRRLELLPSWTTIATPARRGGTLVLAASAVLMAFVVMAAPVSSPQLSALREPQEAEPSPQERDRRPTSDDAPSATNPTAVRTAAAAATAAGADSTDAGTPGTTSSSPGRPGQATPTGAGQTPNGQGRPTQAPTAAPTAAPTPAATARPTPTQPTRTRPTQAAAPTPGQGRPTDKPSKAP